VLVLVIPGMLIAESCVEMLVNGLQNRKQKEDHILNSGESAMETTLIRKMVRVKSEGYSRFHRSACFESSAG
jgi:hypothetical protein